jgi:hypothetical protein
MQTTEVKHVLPFGRHMGQPLAAVPTSYLSWLLRETKLSGGLRSAVAAELESRGQPAPAPPPRPVHPCHECGPGPGVTLFWYEDALGRKRIRAECNKCRRTADHPPCVEPYTTMADANASRTPILDTLTRLEELGVPLQSNGKRTWLRWEDARKVPADVRAAVRQCSHTLAKMVGDSQRAVR